MANDFLEFGLPPILGSIAEGGAGIGQGYVQGLQLRQQLEQNQMLNDLKKWQMQMEQRKANFPKWSVAGEGTLAVQDPQTGQLSFMMAPQTMRNQPYRAPIPVQPGQPLFDPSAGGFITAPGTPKQELPDRKAFDPYQRQAILDLYKVDPWTQPIVGIPGFDWSAVMKGAKEAERKDFEKREQFKAGLKTEEARVPPGYEKVEGGKALRPIPGGPADTKLQGMLNQDTAMLNNSRSAFDRLAVSANEVLNHPGLPRVTGLMGAVPNIPGSAASDAEAKLTTLKSQVGFSVLQEMRNNAKTGGALGQISDRENILLQNNLDALDKAQSYEQMQASLRNIVKYAEGAKDRLQEAYNLKHGEEPPPPKIAAPVNRPAPNKPLLPQLPQAFKIGKPRIKIMSDDSYNRLPSGTVFIGPDGVTRRKP